MHDGVRKKRRLSSAQTTEVKDTSEIENRHLQIQEKQRDEERILLARASVLKEKYRQLVPAYDAPWKEPPKNANHWDHLLSEAAWMWNDMAQERLWKMAVAKQLANEAVAYCKTRSSMNSSSSSTEPVTTSIDALFGVPLTRQFRTALQEIAKRVQRKKTSKYEKNLRKFQREYETKEMAAVFGFEPDEGSSLLNIKIPTQPCVPAPDEEEKDVYPLSPIKSINERRSTKLKPPRQSIPSIEPNGIPYRMNEDKTTTTLEPNDEGVRNVQSDPNTRICVHRSRDWMPISSPDKGTSKDPNKINDFMARIDDQLLFFAAGELSLNWEIVSDVMASAGIFMTPEACKDRFRFIKEHISKTQSHLLRLKSPEAFPSGGMEDMLFRDLKNRAKDVLKKGIPEMLAARYTVPTANAHKDRCMKLRAALNNMNTNAPTCHISQKKLSDVVVKHLGGRLATPKESWNKVRSQNMARHLAERSMQQRLDAAEVAAHQNRLRTAPSNPSSNGNLPSMESQKISSASQGQPQLTPNLGDVAANPWTQQPNVLPGYVQNGGSIGPPNPSQMMPPWFTPPAEVYNKYSPLPSFAGTSQSQSPLERSSMSQVRPGYGGRLKPTHLTNPLQVSPDQMMTARGTRGLYSTQSQLSMNPHYVQQSQHYAKQILNRCQNNKPLLKQYLQNTNCSPLVRQLVFRAMQDQTSRHPLMGQVTPHPSHVQRMGQQPSQVMPTGPGSLMSPAGSGSGDPFGSGHPAMSHNRSGFQTPIMDHPAAFPSRSTVSTPREFVDVQTSTMRPSPRQLRPAFPIGMYDPNPQMDPNLMNMGMQPTGTTIYGGPSLRMHNPPELMHPGPHISMDLRQGMPVNSMDPRHPMHMQDVSMMDPGVDLHGSDPNFLSESRPRTNRPMQGFQRGMPRTFGGK